LPFDTSTLERDQQWIGEGGRRGHQRGSCPAPGVRLGGRSARRAGQPSVWNEAAVTQAARALRSDNAVFVQIVKSGTDLVIQPRLLRSRPAGVDLVALEPNHGAGGASCSRGSCAAATYARTMKVTLTEAETPADGAGGAADPSAEGGSSSTRGRRRRSTRRRPGEATSRRWICWRARSRPTPTSSRAVHAGERPSGAREPPGKAAAQFRASTQLDPTYPEPYKALATCSWPRRAGCSIRRSRRTRRPSSCAVLRRRLRGARRGQGGQG
jgi:hypothetical protein